MSNFYYLTHDDFYIDPNGMKGPVLCNNTEGICVVLFHAEAGRCVHWFFRAGQQPAVPANA